MSDSRKTIPPLLEAARQLLEQVEKGTIPPNAEGVSDAIEIIKNADRFQVEWDQFQAERQGIAKEKEEGIGYLTKERKRYAKNSPKWAAYTQLIEIIETSHNTTLFDIIKEDSDVMKKVVVGKKNINGEEQKVTYTIAGMPEASIQEILYANLGYKQKTATSKNNLNKLRELSRSRTPEDSSISILSGNEGNLIEDVADQLLSLDDKEREQLKAMIAKSYPEQNMFEVNGKKYFVRPSESKEHVGELRIFELDDSKAKGSFGAFHKMDTWKSETWQKFSTANIRGAKATYQEIKNTNKKSTANSEDFEASIKALKHESALGRKAIPGTKIKKAMSTTLKKNDQIIENYILPMEVKAGDELHKVIRNQRKQHLNFDRISIDFLRDLQERFHDQGVVHLDIKPENVMLDSSDLKNPKARLLDFGLSCKVGTTSSGGGTPRYISFEMVKYDSLSPNYEMDVFSAGILLFETLLRPQYLKVPGTNGQPNEGMGLWIAARHFANNEEMSDEELKKWKLKRTPILLDAESKGFKINNDSDRFTLYLTLLKTYGQVTQAQINEKIPYLAVIELMCKENPDGRIKLSEAINRLENLRLTNENAAPAVRNAYTIADKARNRLRNMRLPKEGDNKFDYSEIRKIIDESLTELEKNNPQLRDNLASDTNAAYEEYLHTLGIRCLSNYYENTKSYIGKESTKDFILRQVDSIINEFEAIFVLAKQDATQHTKIETRYQKLILEANKSRITLDAMADLNKKNIQTLSLSNENSNLVDDFMDIPIIKYNAPYDPLTEVQKLNLAVPLANPIQTLIAKNNSNLAHILQEVNDNTNQSIIVNKVQPMSTLSLMKEEFAKKANFAKPNLIGDSCLFGQKYEKELLYRAVYKLDSYLKQGNQFTSLKQLIIFQQKKDIMKYCQREIEVLTKTINARYKSGKSDPTVDVLIEKRKAFLNLQLVMKLYLKAYDMPAPAAIALMRRKKPDSMKYFTDKLKRFSLLSHSGDTYHKICLLPHPDVFLQGKKLALNKV